MRDLVYYYSKLDFTKHELGEIQTGFNFSFVIDGTKDSAKIVIISFQESEVEPNTIIYHEKSNSWWIISNDKVERYQYENKPIYKHSLTLNGAIDLLNARDLTDCGFYQNKYTIRDFFFRLIELSNLEFAHKEGFTISLEGHNLINLDKVVDYIKTFENYTLLSAINEFFDAYNIVCKLRFTEENGKLNGLVFDLYSKSGDTRKVIDESIFNDVRETKTMDKNSFGTTVVSNAENVISTKEKVFPNVGGIRATGTQYEMQPDNSIVRLPSNIDRVNWVKITRDLIINISYKPNVGDNHSEVFTANGSDRNTTINSFNKAIEKILYNLTPQIAEKAREDLYKELDSIIGPAMLGSTTTLYGGWRYDPINDKIIIPEDNKNFYKPYFHIQFGFGQFNDVVIGITDKETRDNIKNQYSCFYFERGKNYIGGLNMLTIGINRECHPNGYLYTDLRDSSYDGGTIYKRVIGSDYGEFGFNIVLDDIQNEYSLSRTSFIINYVPMSDLKIKLDNDADRYDTHLYNQNGKLTDSVALSKMLLSYIKEIESDNITRFATFYDLSQVPQVGSVVFINNDFYVINNVSLDFAQNENFEYVIRGEFSMSKFMATKSLLTNPNTNIRDYGIPQNHNVARKQLYRDFYELSHSTDSLADNDKYMGLDQVVNFGSSYKETTDHTGVIKLGFKQPYGGETEESKSDTWYYQLDTTTYILKKSFIQILTFNDNNIIGYGSQSATCGFDITRIFTGGIDYVNTPISYVDDNGEFQSIDIAFTTAKQLIDIYKNYVERMKIKYDYPNFNNSIYNYSVFIDQEIFEGHGEERTETFTHTNNTIARLTRNNIYGIRLNLKNLGFLPTDFEDDINSLNIITQSVSYGGQTYRPIGGITKDSSGNYIYKGNINITSTSQILTLSLTLSLKHTYIIGVGGAKDNCDFMISEKLYNKDPIEVPVFEYCFQIDDSKDVLIGSNILDNRQDDICYIYQYAIAPKNTINDNNFENLTFADIDYNGLEYIANNVVKFNIANGKVEFELYGQERIDPNILSETTYFSITDIKDLLRNNEDIVITRVKPILDKNEIPSYERDLMFVVRNTENADYETNDKMLLTINHYKLS